MWTWFETEDQEKENTKDSSPSALVQTQTGKSIVCLIEVLESLFDFIATHFFPGVGR